jgi:hypothetical protein
LKIENYWLTRSGAMDDSQWPFFQFSIFNFSIFNVIVMDYQAIIDEYYPEDDELRGLLLKHSR